MTNYLIDLPCKPTSIAEYVDEVNERDAGLREAYQGRTEPEHSKTILVRHLTAAIRAGKHAETAKVIADRDEDWAAQLNAANESARIANSKLAQLQVDYGRAFEKVSSLGVANTNLLAANHNLQSEWANENRAVRMLETEVTELRTERNELLNKAATLKYGQPEVKNLKRLNDEQSTTIDLLRSQLAEVKRDRDQKFDRDANEIETLRATNRAVNTQCGKLLRALNQSRDMLAGIKSQVTSGVLVADRAIAGDFRNGELPE